MSNSNRTALITGANSGLGFEAAAQLAEDGWGSVILACRSIEKGEAARAQLKERTGKDPFSTIAVDTSEIAPARAAVAELKKRGVSIDFLLLNAGASSEQKRANSDGIEVTYASTLIGHHVLTMGALEQKLLSPTARIVISGSEAARGGMPGMKVHDVEKLAASGYSGDRVAAIEALMKLEAPTQTKFVNMSEYATAKLFVAWWAAALSRNLPEGMTVNAVSPGAALETNFARGANAMMKHVMMPMMKLLGPIMGTQGPISDAARRYIDAADYADDRNGHFYATAHPKRFVGPVGIQTSPDYFLDATLQQAGFDALVGLTGAGLPDAASLHAVA